MKYTKNKNGIVTLVSDEGNPLDCPFQSQHLVQTHMGQPAIMPRECSSKCALFHHTGDSGLIKITQRCAAIGHDGLGVAVSAFEEKPAIIGPVKM